jgi:Coenzyme PQQ synthesis protein D (PqqD)
MEKIMTDTLTLDMICIPSEDVVAREIEGEIIIVPLIAGIGDMEDELYTLNSTGKAIWTKLDGVRTLRQIASELAEEYSAPVADIEQAVTGLVSELVLRKMVIVQ